jgi:hypothetical protein
VGLIRIEDEQFGYIEVTSQCILELAKSSALKVACLLGKQQNVIVVRNEVYIPKLTAPGLATDEWEILHSLCLAVLPF